MNTLIAVPPGKQTSTLAPLTTPANPKASGFDIKRILVPVDFSACSRKALQYALAFAKQFGSEIVLLNVVQVNIPVGEYSSIDFSELEAEVCRNSQEQLNEWAKKEVLEMAPVNVLLRTGSPASVIAEVANHLTADLIVISTHGRTGLKHVWLGSVAENVVRLAPCPVLVVRQHEHEFVSPSMQT